MSKAPIILKKEDSQKPSRVQLHHPIQPKILTKASVKENVPSVTPKKSVVEEGAPKPMKSCLRLISSNLQLDTKFLEYLDGENIDFLVVALVGMKNVGKTTLANILAHPQYFDGHTFCQENEIFPTNGLGVEVGVVIDMFITADRIILLDCSPLLHNIQKRERDMIFSESELHDIQAFKILLENCHLVTVVHEGFPDLSVSRIISLAEHMSPNESKHRPLFASVANKVQPGKKVLHFDSRIHDGANLYIPDLHHPSVELHDDVNSIIQEFQESVFMMKRWSMESDEVFTEKMWGQRLMKSVEQIKKGDYFSRKYEALSREKFHQAVENC